jgi:thiamine-phosphate pyrophosphorylase
VKLRGLYAITPESPDAVEKVRRALEGGIALLQYRNKQISKEARLQEATRIALLARGYGVPLIINDDVGLTLQAGAQGVHLGRDDGALGAARARLPGKLLGASCYDNLDLARQAVGHGADYIAFGSVFTSATKPGAVRAPLALFAAARPLGVPLCAIGGITLENAEQVIGAGADLLAVISDLFDAADITGRARQFGKLFS